MKDKIRKVVEDSRLSYSSKGRMDKDSHDKLVNELVEDLHLILNQPNPSIFTTQPIDDIKRAVVNEA